MASERKQFLKEQIIRRMQNFIEDSDISLEELEDCAAELDQMLHDEDELIIKKEKTDDKQSDSIRKNRKKSI